MSHRSLGQARGGVGRTAVGVSVCEAESHRNGDKYEWDTKQHDGNGQYVCNREDLEGNAQVVEKEKEIYILNARCSSVCRLERCCTESETYTPHVSLVRLCSVNLHVAAVFSKIEVWNGEQDVGSCRFLIAQSSAENASLCIMPRYLHDEQAQQGEMNFVHAIIAFYRLMGLPPWNFRCPGWLP